MSTTLYAIEQDRAAGARNLTAENLERVKPRKPHPRWRCMLYAPYRGTLREAAVRRALGHG